jgi:hypothetical protein
MQPRSAVAIGAMNISHCSHRCICVETVHAHVLHMALSMVPTCPTLARTLNLVRHSSWQQITRILVPAVRSANS